MKKEIAVCGLDCNTCPFPSIHTSLENAQKWVGLFREWKVLKEGEGAKEIMKHGPYCISCHDDRSVHWSANCWILKCCVDDKGLKNCSQCNGFPCNKLVEWSNTDEGYKKALDNLKKLKRTNPM
ncbi:MAG: DUF3795 domain-containing protein [Candidatus Ratteibacteria bacterium]|nr:DUF3795 domain-containing protein [Candidatus Ratteibacteria bacterium]